MSFEVLPIDSDDDDQIEMLQVERKDEDPAKMMRSKPRHPKCREKWSLLWFIPSTVLNDRVVTSGGKKGKRFGFDRFNELSCKVCHKSFHSSKILAVHKSEAHGGNANFNSTPRRSFSSYSSSSRSTGAVRRSNRRLNNSVNYCDDDDEIEVLDPLASVQSNPRSRVNKSSSDIEVLDIDDDDDDIREVNTSVEITPVTDEIPTSFTSGHVKITRVTEKRDEEILLESDEEGEEHGELIVTKRKHSYDNSPSQKRPKVVDLDDEDEDEMVEVKSSSGKSMLVKRSMLNTVMAGSSPQQSRARKVGA